jgi:hypothetical protein
LKTFARPIDLGGLSRAAAAIGLCALVAACGGGGGGGGASLPIVTTPAATTTTTTTTTTTSSGATPAASTADSNVVAISVDTGPAGATGQVNIPYVKVTICTPNSTSACQTIDHVILDTGSEGLRLVSSVLTNRAALPQQMDSSGNPYAECAQFASGFTWGSVRTASISVGGETAASVPVQIIGDPDIAAVPASCGSAGAAQDTVASFGGNGLLGVSVFRQDCGSACAAAAIAGTYYSCPGNTNCTPAKIPVTQQVSNPVPFFAADNNGVLVQMPAIAAGGATNPTGTLVFGIGTRSNNALGNAKAYATNGQGSLSTTVDGSTYGDSFIDSGSNFLYFDLATLAACSQNGFQGFYCPASTTTLNGTVTGSNGSTGSFTFGIANAVNALNANPSATAFSNIGAQIDSAGSFDYGLPFFYGRNVFTAIEDASTPAGNGPYFGF